ncbi:MAG: helix-turn-helix transcriptional regulator [Ruminococcus sp.]|nr:helix-turn-helix transcriptional regulator [Ruminococcus sp.]
MPTTVDMYNCIEAERARRKLTILEFSELIGVSEKTYRNWRDSAKPISSNLLIKISNVFGCSVDYLLGLSDKLKVK